MPQTLNYLFISGNPFSYLYFGDTFWYVPFGVCWDFLRIIHFFTCELIVLTTPGVLQSHGSSSTSLSLEEGLGHRVSWQFLWKLLGKPAMMLTLHMNLYIYIFMYRYTNIYIYIYLDMCEYSKLYMQLLCFYCVYIYVHLLLQVIPLVVHVVDFQGSP